MKIIERIASKAQIHSLRVQLILYFTIFSLVVLAAGAYMNYRYTWDIFQRNNERVLLQQFRQADNNINIVIGDVDRLSKIFITDDDIQQFLLDNYNEQDFSFYELKESIFSRIDDFTSGYSNYKPYSYINSIYIYTENKGCIGGNETHSVTYTDPADTAVFFASPFYKTMRDSFPKIVLAGGITEQFYRNYKTGNQPHIISIAREIKPVAQPDRSASLIFNVDERYIASIYAGTRDESAGTLSILDLSGKVVSSSDGSNVGAVNPVIGRIEPGSQSGSFSMEGGGVPTQVVYSRLSNTDWYLVGEMPLSFLTRDMMILERVTLFVFLGSILVIFLVSYFWLKKIMRPLNVLARMMGDMGRGELGLTFPKIPKNEFGIVITRFNEMSLGIKDLVRKQEEAQREKRELEIEALQTQINPHFLYNTLNMIKWMAAIIKARNIVDCIVALGNILEPALQRSDTLFTLREEIDYLENYIKIVNWRFDNGVRFKFTVEENLLSCKAPRFILQPIIENSISHGMTGQTGDILISIDAFEQDGDLNIAVSDTGVGIMPEKLKEIRDMLAVDGAGTGRGTGGRIGIYNVHRRVRLNYGPGYGITIESEKEKGTKVCIRIPITK